MGNLKSCIPNINIRTQVYQVLHEGTSETDLYRIRNYIHRPDLDNDTKIRYLIHFFTHINNIEYLENMAVLILRRFDNFASEILQTDTLVFFYFFYPRFWIACTKNQQNLHF